MREKPFTRPTIIAANGIVAAEVRAHCRWKNYVNGLFKMLHTHGSHPGLSDEDHCTFRLDVVLVTTRTFLRRLRQGTL